MVPWYLSVEVRSSNFPLEEWNCKRLCRGTAVDEELQSTVEELPYCIYKRTAEELQYTRNCRGVAVLKKTAKELCYKRTAEAFKCTRNWRGFAE
jgi:hypothetical protein